MGKTIFRQIWTKKSRNCQFCTKTSWNMENSMLLFTFCVLDGKHPFYANLVRNIKIVNWNWNLLIRLIKNLNMQNPVVVFTFSFLFFSFFFFGKTFFLPNAEFSGGTHFFYFKLEALFLFKFGSKLQHCQFKWKFGS